MKLWAVVVLACTISSFSFADTSTNSFKTPAGQTVTIGDQVQDMQKKN
jgi:FlaG/FlaF family flagellin (archaellin)